MSLIIFFAVVAIIAVGILTMSGPWMQKLIIPNLFGGAFLAVAAMGTALFNTVSGGWLWISWALPWTLGSVLLASWISVIAISLFSGSRGASSGRLPSVSFRDHWLALTADASLTVVPAWVVGALFAIILGVLSVGDLLWTARQSFLGG